MFHSYDAMASLTSELPPGEEVELQQSEEPSVEACLKTKKSTAKDGSATASSQAADKNPAVPTASASKVDKKVVILRKGLSGEEKKFCIDTEKVKCVADLAQLFVPTFYTSESDELCPPSSRLLWLAGEDEPAEEDRDSADENHSPLEDGDGGEQGDPPQLPASSDASAFFAHSEELVFSADGEAVYRFMVKVEGPSGNLMEVEESSDDEYSVSEQEVLPRRVPQEPEKIKSIAAAENWLYDRFYRYFLLPGNSDEFKETYGPERLVRQRERTYYNDAGTTRRTDVGAEVQALLPPQYADQPDSRKFQYVVYSKASTEFKIHSRAWPLLAVVLRLSDTEWIKHGWLPPSGVSGFSEVRQRYCEGILFELADSRSDAKEALLRFVIGPALDQVTDWDRFRFAQFANRTARNFCEFPVFPPEDPSLPVARLVFERLGNSRSRLEKVYEGCKSVIRQRYKERNFKANPNSRFPPPDPLHPEPTLYRFRDERPSVRRTFVPHWIEVQLKERLKSWLDEVFVDKFAAAGFPDLGKGLHAFLDTVHGEVTSASRQVGKLLQSLTEPEENDLSRKSGDEENRQEAEDK
ncbi:unnamed protein product [Amoebophrya sp. A120]|nr:unnamed protein product [Amoebophrya sp. A120]CAD7975625.1 unnamed protein product [Amoebophrya sp. A120]|eukprot:GSA120T00012808001.1